MSDQPVFRLTSATIVERLGRQDALIEAAQREVAELRRKLFTTRLVFGGMAIVLASIALMGLASASSNKTSRRQDQIPALFVAEAVAAKKFMLYGDNAEDLGEWGQSKDKSGSYLMMGRGDGRRIMLSVDDGMERCGVTVLGKAVNGKRPALVLDGSGDPEITIMARDGFRVWQAVGR